MSFLQAVILSIIERMNGDRTVSSVFHLLKGKKSSQTIQDAHLYKIDQWFQTVGWIERNEFAHAVQQLVQKGYIVMNDEEKPHITSNGRKAKDDYLKDKPSLSDLHGWKYQNCAQSFWKRLSFLVQVISHLAAATQKYYPVTRDDHIQNWLKTYIRQQQLPKQQLINGLHHELKVLLSKQEADDPLILVLRLSGFKRTGKTTQQAASTLNVEETEYHFRFLNLFHALIKEIASNPSSYPLLYRAMEDIYEPLVLTASTKKTAELIERGYTIDAMAAERNLKQSTIEDHIVELALQVPEFSILPFISEAEIQQVRETAARHAGKKLKPIKDELKELSYFQIRLVLAKYSR
ncbi:uncharacterized protein YpbB [Bacillus ectoiniformans]|uniref:helix-turn-helix domain-containing protein n=1 Tax=Bacillus ectoiniformans TaxID=1494429 RepID=UPI00195D4D7A|nr:helix-turn-helix domain-containing protein [Bacillus ectoiniformans]MBM7648024.1 uncharacterized protein YpbB [Bacillus ectoiniformans]